MNFWVGFSGMMIFIFPIKNKIKKNKNQSGSWPKFFVCLLQTKHCSINEKIVNFIRYRQADFFFISKSDDGQWEEFLTTTNAGHPSTINRWLVHWKQKKTLEFLTKKKWKVKFDRIIIIHTHTHTHTHTHNRPKNAELKTQKNEMKNEKWNMKWLSLNEWFLFECFFTIL